jgi:hypothetical protein
MKNLTTNSIILVVVILIIVIGVSATVISLRNTREKIDANKQTQEMVTGENINSNSANQDKTANNIAKEDEVKFSQSDSKKVKVTAPLPGEKLSSPYIIRGEAIAFENVVNYTLTDEQGQVLAEGFTSAMSPDVGAYGAINQPITFNASSKNGILEVYTLSAKDGSKQDIVRINVKF